MPNSAALEADTGEALRPAEARAVESEPVEGVWKAPRGGAKVAMLAAMTDKVLESGGVVDEMLDGLEEVALE